MCENNGRLAFIGVEFMSSVSSHEQLRSEVTFDTTHVATSIPRGLTFSVEPHPQKKIFGSYSEEAFVGVNPLASFAVISPRYAAVDYGIFKTPTLSDLRRRCGSQFFEVLSCLGVTTEHVNHRRVAFVPPETGRSILLPESDHPVLRDILVKGTGLIDRFVRNNKLRLAERGFDGHLELSEAERDIVHSEILELAGVHVVAGIAVVNHHRVHAYPGFTAWTGNYVRGFRTQTRISNLFEMDAGARKAVIDDAIHRIQTLNGDSSRIGYAEYFRQVLEISAKNVAILQAIGFTQDSFHFGQVTVSGELVDLGIGHFRKPKQVGEVNTLHPWFRYERQPVLMQNMLYKTHAVKAEPEPVELARNARAVLEQQTLFGAIRSFSPESAKEIEAMNPVQVFWNTYHRTYRSFDSARFKRDVLDQIDRYFKWSPEGMLATVPAALREPIRAKYEELLKNLDEHFEKQIETWDLRGSTAIHKQILFGTAARMIAPELELDFSKEDVGVWGSVNTKSDYLASDGSFVNREPDLSWTPSQWKH